MAEIRAEAEETTKPKGGRRRQKPTVQSAEQPAPEGEPASKTEGVKGRRGRSTRPFPAGPFEEALEFAKAIYDLGSGTPVRRLTLFDHLQRTPDSSTSRMLVTNASKYGLIKGNYASEQLYVRLALPLFEPTRSTSLG